jgi:hypothetical protein
MEGAADLLQLALNCSSTTAAAAAVHSLPYTAASTARRVPELLNPDVARRLLVTAATRQRVAAVCKMVNCMQQHVDAATLEALMMLFQAGRPLDLKSIEYLELLTQLPAAAHLSSEAVIRLLLAASAREAAAGSFIVRSVCVLCQLPAAEQFDSAAALQLLQAAVQQGHVPWPLCRLPAARQLSSGEVFQLLQAAVQQDRDMCQLCSLPAGLRGSQYSYSFLCDLPGARQMTCCSVLWRDSTALLSLAPCCALSPACVAAVPACGRLQRCA